MRAERKKGGAPAPTSAATGVDPEPGPRRKLEGLAFYVVYVPAMFVAATCALLFVALVEHYLIDGEA